MTLNLHATPEQVMHAVEALQKFGRANRVPDKPLFGLALALEECGSNIVSHALRGDPCQSFQVVLRCVGTALTIELRDSGPEFDPTRFVVEQQSEHHSRPAGGWGIYLVRRYVDEIRYARQGDQNVLSLTKRWNETTGKE